MGCLPGPVRILSALCVPGHHVQGGAGCWPWLCNFQTLFCCPQWSWLGSGGSRRSLGWLAWGGVWGVGVLGLPWYRPPNVPLALLLCRREIHPIPVPALPLDLGAPGASARLLGTWAKGPHLPLSPLPSQAWPWPRGSQTLLPRASLSCLWPGPGPRVQAQGPSPSQGSALPLLGVTSPPRAGSGSSPSQWAV